MTSVEHFEPHYRLMAPWLPRQVRSVLDIGSGGAFIDIWIARHYARPIEVNLLDADAHVPKSGKNQTGYHADGTVPWKDRHIGMANVRAAVPHCTIIGHRPDPSLTIPADLILSIRSWGHHYPISTYIDLVDRSLRPGGRMVLDIRNGTDGLAALEARGFNAISGNIEPRSVKCQRFAFARG